MDRLGLGISQAIGTGGHDLHASVGGITMLAGIEALGKDPQTKVIVLISKPPSPEVAKRVLAAASKAGKPVVVNFVGADPKSIVGRNLHAVKTLEDAARAAVALAKGGKPAARRAQGKVAAFRLSRGQKYVRGLYSGGTFCYEASLLLGEALGGVRSNAPVRASDAIEDPWHSRGHTVIDLGDDVFTRGRPHPMIDHRLRNERILKEAADPEVAVILLDVVLGYGAHADPAAEMAPVIEAARARAAKKKRRIAFVGFVCGTPADPQGLARQESSAAQSRDAPRAKQRGRCQACRGDRRQRSCAVSLAVSLFDKPLHVVNVGISSFADAVRQAGAGATQLDWMPPAQGDVAAGAALARLVRNGLVEKANKKALDAYLAAQPVLEGIGIARDCVPGMEGRMVLHAGPPIEWQRMCGPMQGRHRRRHPLRRVGCGCARCARARA